MTKRALPLSLSSEETNQQVLTRSAMYDSPNSSADHSSSCNGDDNNGRRSCEQSPSTVSIEAETIPASSIALQSFRKRASFGSLDNYFRSTTASQSQLSSNRSPSASSLKSRTTVLTSSSSSSSNHLVRMHQHTSTTLDNPPSSILGKRWIHRRKHYYGLLARSVASFLALLLCWAAILALLHQFQTAVDDPLSMMFEAESMSTSSSSSSASAPDIVSTSSTRLRAQPQHLRSSSSSSSISLTSPLILGSGATHSIPLPLPKQKVSVVLMNFSRPRMIRESSMMRTLLSHPNIDEVLLLHANPKTAFEFVHPKVVNIDAMETNNELGLSLRFYYCQVAKNEWILHLDDDMEFTTEALNELIIEFERNPKRIVGRFGRDMTPGNSFNGYNSQNRHKSTEVVLTKLMLVERDMCSAFFDYAHLVWNDVILHNGEGPLWNGEDIFMSLVANHMYGLPKDGSTSSSRYNNYAMDWLDVWQADDSLKDYDNGKYDISGGMTGIRFWNWRWWQTVLKRNRHYSYRGHLWKIARERLQELV